MEDTRIPARRRMQSSREQQGTQPARPYEFLELLVLCESGANIADTLEKISTVAAPCRKDLEESLKRLLSDPHEKTAIYLKQKLEEQKLQTFPRVDEKMVEEKRSSRRPQPPSPQPSAVSSQWSETLTLPRVRQERYEKKPKASAVDLESWTLITPVPHLRCPCSPPRPPVQFLTAEEAADAARQRTDLQYQLSTLDFRVRRKLKALLDLYLPGFPGAAACATPPDAVQPVPGTAPTRGARPDVPRRPPVPGGRVPAPRPGLAAASEMEAHARKGRKQQRRLKEPSCPSGPALLRAHGGTEG